MEEMKCEKCGGDMQPNENGEMVCQSCGHVMPKAEVTPDSEEM